MLSRIDKVWIVVSEFKLTVSFLLTPVPYMLFHHPHFQFAVLKKRLGVVFRGLFCVTIPFFILTPSQISKDLPPAGCINIDPGPFLMRNKKLLIQI